MVAVKDSCEVEHQGDMEHRQTSQGVEEGIRIIPGMLRTYDASSGLFGVRYSHGNR